MNLPPQGEWLGGFCDWLWAASLHASVLIALVWLIQLALGKWLRPTWRYALSLLVVIRLVLPAVPASRLSIFNLTNRFTTPSVRPVTRASPKPAGFPIPAEPRQAFALGREQSTANPVTGQSPGLGMAGALGGEWDVDAWHSAGEVVWLLGFGLILTAATLRHRRFSRWAAQAEQVTDEALLALLARCQTAMGVAQPLKLRRASDLSIPALFGWRKPCLLMPENIINGFDSSELRMIFLHELAHLKRRDVLLNWVMIVIRGLHWFNPLVWLAMRDLRSDRELVCDSMVLAQLDARERRTYGDTLIKLLSHFSAIGFCPSLAPAISRKQEIKRRVSMIAEFKPSNCLALIASAALLAVLCLSTFTSAADQETPAPAHVADQSASKGKRSQLVAANEAWSETSATVRAPKSVLSQIAIQPVVVTNFERMEFVLTDKFTQAFRLTSPEVERVTAGLAEALHQWRLEEGKHLEPIDKEPDLGPFPVRRLPASAERFFFHLTPFPQEAAAIRRRLDDVVLATLGEQRAKLFWQNGRGMLDGEMNPFTKETQLPDGMARSITYTFALDSGNPPSRIDRLVRTVMTDHGKVNGTSGGGRPYGAALDEYAPEKMKPVLARWRQMIAERAAKSGLVAAARTPPSGESRAPAEAIPLAGRQAEAAAPAPPSAPPFRQKSAQWDDTTVLVDLPKTVVHSLKVPGLTVEGEISPEAEALFKLTPAEAAKVRSLYEEMRVRFERLERSHFERTQPDTNSFVLRAFPEESAALRDEWVTRLKGLIGANRGELLDYSIRTPVNPMDPLTRVGPPRNDPERRIQDYGADWLHRGTDEVRFDVSSGAAGRDGRPTLRIEHKTIKGGGGSGSWSGRPDQIPERWRHLLTPDLLSAPAVL